MRSGYRMMMHWKVLWEATYPSSLGHRRRKVDVDSCAQRPKFLLYLCDNTSGQDKRAKRTNRSGHLALAVRWSHAGAAKPLLINDLTVKLEQIFVWPIAGTFDLFLPPFDMWLWITLDH